MKNKSFSIHPAAEKIVHETLNLSKKIFSERWIAAYLLGSLARGGFSAHDSDIDFAIILQDPLLDSDQDNINTICAQIKGFHPPLSKKLSIFWDSVRNIEQGFTSPKARFPAFDRADFFQNGQLLEGKEVRRSPYILPNQYELEREGIQLALAKLNHPKILYRIAYPQSLFLQPDIPPSKIILFPIRLIYTASTGQVGGNIQAAEYYYQHYIDDTAVLVKEALGWRQQLPNLQDIDFTSMKERLILIYKRCLSIYIEKMQNNTKTKSMDIETLNQLKAWKNSLENL